MSFNIQFELRSPSAGPNQDFEIKKGEARSFTNSIILYKSLTITAEVIAVVVYEDIAFKIRRIAKIELDVRD